MNAVGIDVSKKKSTVTIRQPGDVVLLPPKDYRHTQSSINDLIETIKGLDGETKVCMEHTGRYYEPMASWLTNAGIFVSAVACGLWYVALRHLSPGELGAFGYLTPVVSLILAMIFFAERPSWHFYAALVLIVGGVMLMVNAPAKRR